MYLDIKAPHNISKHNLQSDVRRVHFCLRFSFNFFLTCTHRFWQRAKLRDTSCSSFYQILTGEIISSEFHVDFLRMMFDVYLSTRVEVLLKQVIRECIMYQYDNKLYVPRTLSFRYSFTPGNHVMLSDHSSRSAPPQPFVEEHEVSLHPSLVLPDRRSQQ
ncbi:hypothetical protein JOM56_007896 [Amanita muscaria]